MRSKRLVKLILLLAVISTAINTRAQSSTAPAPRSPLDAISWGVVYDVPGTKQVKVSSEVPYLSDARGTLAVDIYSPADMKPGEKRPAVVFMNAIGDAPNSKVKSWGIYSSWPRLVAAHGLIGVSMDADGSRIQDCLRGVFDFLSNKGAAYGIDGSRLGLYAASANVTGTNEYLGSSAASKNIRAAALYYGGVPSGNLRADLPVLFIVAQSDAPRMGPQLTGLWQRVVESRTPWTLLFASGMPHAFDAFSDNDDARHIVQQSIAFWKSHLEPVSQPPWPKSTAREIVAASYGNENQHMVDLLGTWLKDNPNDSQAYLMLGRGLQRLSRFDEAGKAFEKAQSLGVAQRTIWFNMGQLRAAENKYDEAAQFFNQAISAGLQESFVYTQLAYMQLRGGHNLEGVQSYEKALSMGLPAGARGVAYYNLACGHAKLGQKEKALDALANAVNEGFNNRSTYETDPTLEPLRSEPRFKEILTRLRP